MRIAEFGLRNENICRLRRIAERIYAGVGGFQKLHFAERERKKNVGGFPFPQGAPRDMKM